MSVTTEKVRELLSSRLGDLDEEKRKIERAIEALGTNGTAPAPTRRARRPGRRKQRRGGKRADQAIELIGKTPGISAADVAARMGIKPNYLYRLLGDLAREGRVVKEGRSYRLAGGA